MPFIRNKRTGEMIEVQDTELQSYGIRSPQPQQEDPVSFQDNTPAVETAAPVQPQKQSVKSITGRSLEDHAVALSRAKLAGDKVAIKSIEDDYDREFQYQKEYGVPQQKESAKMEDAKKLKNNIVQASKAVLKVLDDKAAGKYKSEKEYQTALQFASSRMSSAQGFGEGGKVLSPAELGILTGSLISIVPQENQNWWERNVTGYVPPATGKIADEEDEDTIRFKMNNAIGYIENGQLPDPSQAPQKRGGMGILDAVKGVGQQMLNDTVRPAQDIGAGIGSMMNQGNIEQMEAQAKAWEDEAFKTQDLQQRNVLLGNAQKIRQSISEQSEQTADSFSEDVNQNPAWRGLKFGATIATAAEAPGIAALGKQVLRHPVQATKAVAGGVKQVLKDPTGAAKQFIKNDYDASFTRQPLAPKFNSGMSIDDAVDPGTPPQKNQLQQNYQRTLRQGTDLVNGGGSDEYVARQAKKPWLPPQNQVLQEEGVYSHPTHTGRVQATNKSLVRYGTELERAYSNSPVQFSTDGLRDKMIRELMDEGGVPTQDAQKIVGRITQDLQSNGQFVIGSGDTMVDAKTLWKGTRWLEKYNPNIPKDPDATAYLKANSKVITRMLRSELGDAIPETQAINGKYSALRDFAENEYDFGGGVGGSFGSWIKPVTTPIKNVTNAAGNILSNPKASIKSYTEKPSLSMADGRPATAGESATTSPLMNQAPEGVVPGRVTDDFVDMSQATIKGKAEAWRTIKIEREQSGDAMSALKRLRGGAEPEVPAIKPPAAPQIPAQVAEPDPVSNAPEDVLDAIRGAIYEGDEQAAKEIHAAFSNEFTLPKFESLADDVDKALKSSLTDVEFENIPDAYKNVVKKMSAFVQRSGEKVDKSTQMLYREHIPEGKFGQSSDEVASALGMDERQFMDMLNSKKKINPSINPLTEEAKKHKSVEDFIDSQKNFRDGHAAPGMDDTPVEARIEDGGDFNLTEVVKGQHTQPDDYFDPQVGARYYNYNDEAGKESLAAINSVKRGAKTITAYRTVPKEIDVDKLIDRDWISFSKKYALDHGESRFGEGEYKIIKQEVKPDEVWWDGNDIREWGYDTGMTKSLSRSDLIKIWNEANK